MKQILAMLIMPFLLCGMSVVQAQSGCALYINTDFDSECMLTEFFKNDSTLWEQGMEDCLLACKGNTVHYTAVCPNGGQYTWAISGAASYSLNDQGRTAVVTWGAFDVGHISVSLVTTDSNTCTAEACVLLMDPPLAASTTIPAYYIDQNNNKVIEVCMNATVELMDVSVAGTTPIVGCYWDTPFGDATTPHHSFTATQSGTYTIQHRVMNECGCEDIETYTLKVLAPLALDLSCYGTACGGDTATYTLVNPTCTQYMWSVEGGSYTVDATDPASIHVQWGMPSSGYGVISIDASHCNSPCPALTSIRIPVISDNTVIAGPDVVCVGDVQLYELPLWGSTSYNWQITPLLPNPEIPTTDDPNQVLIEFSSVGAYTLEVTYSCDFLPCGPFSLTKIIKVKDTFNIKSTDNILCVGATGHYTTYSGQSMAWRVYNSVNQQIYQTTSDTPDLYYSFTQSGRYRVVASNGNYCRDAEYWVTVLDGPPALTSTSGPHEACPYSSIELSATPTHPNYYLEWQPVCGNVPQEGDEVTIGYGAAVCDVKVFQIDAETGCRSAEYLHAVGVFQLEPSGLPATIVTCAGSTVHLSVLDQSENVTYEWTVSPANAASVIDDHLLPSVDILTNHLTNATTPYPVYVTLERTYCTNLTQQTTVVIMVHDVTAPTLVYDDTVCENVLVPFTATGGTAVSSHYTWRFSDTTLVFHGASFSRKFHEDGHVNFTLTYQPDAACDSVVVHGSLYVRERIPANIFYSNDTLRTFSIQGLTYQWTHNGIPVCTTSYCEVADITGEYCCTISYADNPTCPVTSCYTIEPSPIDTCLVAFLDTSKTCNVVRVWVSNPSHPQCSWGISTGARGSHITPIQPGSDTAIAYFYVPGTYYISVSAEIGTQCYHGSMPVTIDCVPEFELSYDCNGNIVVEDKSLYRTGYAIPVRTYSIAGVGSVSLTPPAMAGAIYIGNPSSTTTYTVSMTMANSDCIFTDSITVEPSPTIISIDIPNNMCENTPFLFSATTTGSNLQYHWDFGDWSYNYGNGIYHTYNPIDGINHIVTLTISNEFGCTASAHTSVAVFTNGIEDGTLSANGSSVCTGTPFPIYFNPHYPSVNQYYWEYSQSGSYNNTYNTTHTGDYHVLVITSDYGCKKESIINVGFLNAPTARITGKTSYCLGDEVKLNGNTGAHNQYLWNIVGPSNHSFSTANIAFTPTQAGTYYDTLTVTSQNGCTATAIDSVVVNVQPAAPNIAFFGNECIHQPPVVVHSTTNMPLLWNNGYCGAVANYYVSGYLHAYYIDTITGCPSSKAQLFIPPAPNYDALLTGCYKKCPDELPDSLHTYLYPYNSGACHWNWYGNTTGTVSGISHEAYLPVRNYGNYHMDMQYGNGCVATSPTLSITTDPHCPCEDVTAGVISKKCFTRGCILMYGMTIEICNDGDNPVTFNQITANGNSSIASVATLPVTVPAHDCRTIYVEVKFMDFATGYVSFTLYDLQQGCEVSFSEYFDWSQCIKDCSGSPNKLYFLQNLSTPHQTAYFHFNIALPTSTSSVVYLWSTPPQVINYSFMNPPADVDGILMLNYGQLTQLAAAGQTICIDVIICQNTGDLCHVQVCFKASYVLSLIPSTYRQLGDSPGDESTKGLQSASSEVPTDGPYLVPNPARDEVTVMGLAPESVAEITVLTMDGRQTAVFRNDCRFDVSHITKAIYIVRVVTTDRKVYYLKLVKQ